MLLFDDVGYRGPNHACEECICNADQNHPIDGVEKQNAELAEQDEHAASQEELDPLADFVNDSADERAKESAAHIGDSHEFSRDILVRFDGGIRGQPQLDYDGAGKGNEDDDGRVEGRHDEGEDPEELGVWANHTRGS